MKSERDEITDLFRTQLSNVELPIDAGLWNSIEQDVDKNLHRKHLQLVRFMAAASILMVLALSSVAFWLLTPKEEISSAFKKVAQAPTAPQAQGTDVSQSLTANASSCNGKTRSAYAPDENRQTIADDEVNKDDENNNVSVRVTFTFTDENPYHNTINDNNDLWQAGTSIRPYSGITDEDKIFNAALSKDITLKPLHLKVALGTALSASHNHYKMPLIASVTLEKMVSNHIGIETGLQYSLLPSSERDLHYIGVPLKMNVHFMPNRKVDLYASAGALADKCFAGAPDNSFRSEPIQLSASIGAGIRYKISNRMALFAEPSVSHSFSTSSELQTLRTERPTNFNMTCGLQVNY